MRFESAVMVDRIVDSGMPISRWISGTLLPSFQCAIISPLSYGVSSGPRLEFPLISVRITRVMVVQLVVVLHVCRELVALSARTLNYANTFDHIL